VPVSAVQAETRCPGAEEENLTRIGAARRRHARSAEGHPSERLSSPAACSRVPAGRPRRTRGQAV